MQLFCATEANYFMSIPEKLGERISEAIESSGVTINDLVDYVGVKTETLRRWRKGIMVPNVLNLIRIAEKTNKNVGFFYGTEPEPSPAVDVDKIKLSCEVEFLQRELTGYKTEIKEVLGKCSEGLKNTVGNLANSNKGR